jgi:hypothetical protein
MKKIITLAALVSAMFAGSAAHAAAVYNYQFVFENGIIVNGKFSGTAAGNLITGLSSITASVNGVALNGSGNLYASKYHNGPWESGAGVASSNGLENNFLFIDVDYPTNSNFTNYFYDINIPDAINQAYVGTPSVSYGENQAGLNKAAKWTLTAANSVPEPTSMLLLGIGIAGLVAARRSKAA